MKAEQWFVIEGNRQRLDGGAMFGNAPKALWSRWYEAAHDNTIEIANRSLLVRCEDGRHVLFETGVGVFFEPTLRARYGIVDDDHKLINGLSEHGLGPDDIDAIVLSHCHFDHIGGLFSAPTADGSLDLLFKNAEIYVSDVNWQRACRPHPRDRASFISQLIKGLADCGKLHRVAADCNSLLNGLVRPHFSDGHTPGLLMSELQLGENTVVFASDLVPALSWTRLSMTMGYDRYPELVIDEKTALLNRLASQQGHCFLVHDPEYAFARIEPAEKPGDIVAQPCSL